MQKAIFAMGCFWSPQLLFSKTPGVKKAVVGYIGGDESKGKVNYDSIWKNKTGHAEAVQVSFDENKISYKELIELFWSNHDPTQLNRQGPDIGSQYRSEIFYLNNEQKEIAGKTKKQIEKKLGKKVVTLITKAPKFHKAEEYHQDYLKKRGQTTCHI